MGNVFKNPDTPQEVGRVAEKRTCKRLHGKLMPGSGSLDGAKSDFEAGGFRFECKATQAKSLSLKLEWLEKISQEALERSQVPALSIQFVSSSGKPKRNGSYVLIPEDVFQELFE